MAKLKVKRRALYPYTCTKCGKKRNSLIYLRAADRICTICRKKQVPENQPTLFEEKLFSK